MGYEINWTTNDQSVLTHPLYLKWSVKTMYEIVSDLSTVKTDMRTIVMNRDSAGITAYMSWLVRSAVLIS